jgi:predicted nucleic acid-binding protein
MKVYDASAILNLLEEGILPNFHDSSTITLAIFEIGNAVWKHVHLTKKLSQHEGEIIIHSATKMIEKMFLMNIEAINAWKLAIKEGLTYYDSSYLQAALSSKSELITDDKRLRDRAKKYVKVSSSV